MIETSRRGLLLGLGGVILTAPAIVRASSLMAIKPQPKLIHQPRPLFGAQPIEYVTYEVVETQDGLRVTMVKRERASDGASLPLIA